MSASEPDRPLEGKVALITGASRRIGRAVALGLAKHGAGVAVTAKSAREEINAVAEEIRGLGANSVAVMGDVTSEADAANMVSEVVGALGRIDILVNNAAVRRGCPLLEMSLEEWREINAVVLDGAFLMCREALPVMLAQGAGTIINVGGVSGHIGAKGRAHVAAAKAGLTGLTKAIAVEFADRGIIANCVAPGKIGGKRSATSGTSPEMGVPIPLGRQGEISEAAGIIVMMCLPSARFMTGQTVHVSGGLFMP